MSLQACTLRCLAQSLCGDRIVIEPVQSVSHSPSDQLGGKQAHVPRWPFRQKTAHIGSAPEGTRLTDSLHPSPTRKWSLGLESLPIYSVSQPKESLQYRRTSSQPVSPAPIERLRSWSKPRRVVPIARHRAPPGAFRCYQPLPSQSRGPRLR